MAQGLAINEACERASNQARQQVVQCDCQGVRRRRLFFGRQPLLAVCSSQPALQQVGAHLHRGATLLIKREGLSGTLAQLKPKAREGKRYRRMDSWMVDR